MGVRADNSTNYVHADEPNLLNLHKAMGYNNFGQPTIRTTGSNVQFAIDISLGNVEGLTNVYRHGYNPSCANNTEESLWTGSTIYPWATWDGAGAVTIDFTSSSASDTMQVLVEGLDTNYVAQSETITLNGTSTVTTTKSYRRINDLTNNSSTTTVGAISGKLHGTATTVAYMNAGYNHSQNGFYTVPAGYTALLFQGGTNIGKGNDGTLQFKYKLLGKSFITAHVVMLYQDSYIYPFTFPLALPEKTDLDVTLIASNSGTACACHYNMLLVTNA